MKRIISLSIVCTVTLLGCGKKNKEPAPAPATDISFSVVEEVKEDSVIIENSIDEGYNDISQTNVDDATIEAYNAYVDYIGNRGENLKDSFGNDPQNPSFYLVPIDGDDIPEMIIMTNAGNADIYVLSYKDGKVTSDVITRQLYIDIDCKDSIVSSYKADYIGYSYITYKLNESGKLEKLCSHIETASEETTNDNNIIEELYYIGSEEVTDAEYFKFVDKLSEDDTDMDYGQERFNTENYYKCTEGNLAKLRKGEIN